MGEHRDFQALRTSGAASGSTHTIGQAVVRWRAKVGAICIRLGATPNRLTLLGFVITIVCGVCLLIGAGHRAPWDAGATVNTPVSWWPVAAFACLLIACVFDMLDGEVARAGKMATPFGGILDSTLDRFSDIAIFLAIAIYFAMRGNVTYNVLAIVAMCNAYLISYIKARAEDIIDDCSVGWWQRGERCVTLLIGMATGHIPAILWQLAVLPLFTVMRRILYARAVLDAQRRGSPPPNRGPMPGVLRYAALWRHPRGSIGFDVVAFANVAFIIVAPWVCPFFYGDNDPLRALLNSLTG